MIRFLIWYSHKLFETSLMIASKLGHTDIVKILLKQSKVDINAKNVDLIH